MIEDEPSFSHLDSHLELEIKPKDSSFIIKPDCRDRLTPDDFDYVAEILSKREKDKAIIQSLLADPNERNQILEHDALFEKIITREGEISKISPYLYFYVISRRALLREDVNDPEIADYCSNLLTNYIYKNPLVSDPSNPHELPSAHLYMIDQLNQLIHASREEVFLFRYRLANHALFVSSAFPDFIRYQAKQKLSPSLRYFDTLGSTSFAIASKHKLAQKHGIDDILEEISLLFRPIRKGLHYALVNYANIDSVIQHNVKRALEKKRKTQKN